MMLPKPAWEPQATSERSSSSSARRWALRSWLTALVVENRSTKVFMVREKSMEIMEVTRPRVVARSVEGYLAPGFEANNLNKRKSRPADIGATWMLTPPCHDHGVMADNWVIFTFD